MGLLQKAQPSAPIPPGKARRPNRGFLEKAHALRADDNIEQLCLDRLKRLESGNDAPFAALTILKAYYPSVAEIVFLKKGDKFQAQDSVGVSENACSDESVRLPDFELPHDGEGYHSFPASELGLTCLPNGAKAFAFPVSLTESSVDGFLVFVTNGSEFPTSSIGRIVKAYPHKFARLDFFRALELNTNAETAAKVIFEALGDAHILVFKLSDGGAWSSESLAELARSRLGSHGKAVAIGPSRVAVFLKSALDRELYANQLLNSFRKSLSAEGEKLKLERADYAADLETALSILRR